MESLSRLSPFADFFWSMMVYVSLGNFVSHFSSYGMLWHAMAAEMHSKQQPEGFLPCTSLTMLCYLFAPEDPRPYPE